MGKVSWSAQARRASPSSPQAAAAHSNVWQSTRSFEQPGAFEPRQHRKLRLLKLALVQAAIFALSACGGGYGGDGGGGYQTPPPAAQSADAQFTDEIIDGLG